MLENELKMKCKTDPKLIWPVLFKHFIDDGIGITKGNREDVIYWIEKFNELRKTVQIDKYNWDGRGGHVRPLERGRASTLNAVQTQTCSMPKNTAGASFHQGISSTEGLNRLPASCSTISY